MVENTIIWQEGTASMWPTTTVGIEAWLQAEFFRLNWILLLPSTKWIKVPICGHMRMPCTANSYTKACHQGHSQHQSSQCCCLFQSEYNNTIHMGHNEQPHKQINNPNHHHHQNHHNNNHIMKMNFMQIRDTLPPTLSPHNICSPHQPGWGKGKGGTIKGDTSTTKSNNKSNPTITTNEPTQPNNQTSKEPIQQ